VIEGKNPNITFHVDIKDGGRFFLYFANCEPYTPVSFEIRVEQYNYVGPSGRKDYLSVGETELNVVYWVRRLWLCWRGGVPRGWGGCLTGHEHGNRMMMQQQQQQQDHATSQCYFMLQFEHDSSVGL
jgi:hypothetical protein